MTHLAKFCFWVRYPVRSPPARRLRKKAGSAPLHRNMCGDDHTFRNVRNGVIIFLAINARKRRDVFHFFFGGGVEYWALPLYAFQTRNHLLFCLSVLLLVGYSDSFRLRIQSRYCWIARTHGVANGGRGRGDLPPLESPPALPRKALVGMPRKGCNRFFLPRLLTTSRFCEKQTRK